MAKKKTSLPSRANSVAKPKSTKTLLKSDTTKVPKPYKVDRNEIGSTVNNTAVFYKQADSTKKKMQYNRETVLPATLKRNQERLKEGKKALSPTGVKSTLGIIIGLSDKGKSFKSAPLKRVKKK